MANIRERASEALVKCCVPMNDCGFLYIVDAMELYETNNAPFSNMRVAYEMIARRRNQDYRFVMENIKKAIEESNKNCKTGAWVRYFGFDFVQKTNGNYLAYLWERLREEDARNKGK